ncbi:hypothetical protein J4E93_001102 [Alternaria ventricosa]|uniref:uncharacterized protein n=1 Tax=Alternaria ventricosa TaxID=1187951 RepID=UPI0020C3990E|nr:uncharacterized protein J4E93_001102 [Alternaria ventricosa]KAI4653339.1 hypothetical protein J4E93_001102 [Alternaria ventricosa]
MPAAKMHKVWRLKHQWKGKITFGYTNSKELRELHQKLLPEFYEGKNKLKDDDEWDPKEVEDTCEWRRCNGGALDLQNEFPEHQWPEGDLWATQWLLKEMREVYRLSSLLLITYPATLPKDGNIPDGKTAKALTNHLRFEGFFVDVLKGKLKLEGWEVEDIGVITYEEASKTHKVNDGEPVEIPEGQEWDCDEKAYGTKTDDSTTTTIGHTNEHHIVQTSDDMIHPSPFVFETSTFLFAKNEKEIEKAKESDGGCVAVHEDLTRGNTGDGKWITRGLQAGYLEFEAQKKARGGEQAPGTEIVSPN